MIGWPDFGIGKIGSTAVIAAALSGVLFGAYSCWEDRVGDRRQAELERAALEETLRTIDDSNQRRDALVNLPRFAKIWCANDGKGTACCQPDAVRVPRCTHDPTQPETRPAQ